MGTCLPPAADVRAACDPHRKFDCLISDLFGVVISFDEDIVNERLARHCADPASARIALRGLVSQHDLIRGRLSLEQLHRRLVAAHGLSLDMRDFRSAWLAPYSKPMPEMPALLDELAEHHDLILLSNVDKDYWEVVLEEHSELRYFSTKLLSWNLGAAKPEAEVFLRSIEAARTPASRCFFVDDKSENIEAAFSVGLRGHTFVGVDDLRAVFRHEGILPGP